MRSRWEAGADDTKLDEPVAITQRQLRSLTRGARAGMFGILLAVVAIGLAAWSMLAGPRSVAHEAPTAVSPQQAEATPAPPADPAVTPAPEPTLAQTAATTPTATTAPAKSTTRLAEATPAKASSRRRAATKAMKAEDIRTPITIPAPEVFSDSTK
jgi:hypothetical protein